MYIFIHQYINALNNKARSCDTGEKKFSKPVCTAFYTKITKYI